MFWHLFNHVMLVCTYNGFIYISALANKRCYRNYIKENTDIGSQVADQLIAVL